MHAKMIRKHQDVAGVQHDIGRDISGRQKQESVQRHVAVEVGRLQQISGNQLRMKPHNGLAVRSLIHQPQRANCGSETVRDCQVAQSLLDPFPKALAHTGECVLNASDLISAQNWVPGIRTHALDRHHARRFGLS